MFVLLFWLYAMIRLQVLLESQWYHYPEYNFSCLIDFQLDVGFTFKCKLLVLWLLLTNLCHIFLELYRAIYLLQSNLSFLNCVQKVFWLFFYFNQFLPFSNNNLHFFSLCLLIRVSVQLLKLYWDNLWLLSNFYHTLILLLWI